MIYGIIESIETFPGVVSAPGPAATMNFRRVDP